MRKPKQLEFVGKWFVKPEDSFGGSLLKGNPRMRRPLDSKLPVHVTLRAQKSVMRLPKTMALVATAIESTAKRHGVKVYRSANVGNHLHLLIKISRNSCWAPFIRELTGRIAQEIRAKVPLDGSLWIYRPHTRVVRGWRRAFQIAKEYIYLNNLEAEGWINRRETKDLKDLRAIFSG